MSDGAEYAGAEHGAVGRPAIRTEALVRRYGPTTAVAGIDLEVGTGEVYGFIGPNGAGKSTLVRVLCTLVRPTGGRAVVAGHDVATHPTEVRRRIGTALQDAALDDRQTGRELLTLQGRLYGLRRKDVRRRVDEVLDLVAIGTAIDRRIGTYSGGMKRRVDLAAALVHDPAILFLDEPTTGLDPDSRERVWEEVRRLNGELEKTIFLTTQYLEEADALAGRIGVIADGRLVAEGTPWSLKRTVGHDVIEAELDETDPAIVDRITELDGVDQAILDGGRLLVTTADATAVLSPVAVELGRGGARVRQLSVRTPTLDDVFRQLTRGAGDRSPVASVR